ncbi:MAG: hypothetical protein HUK26_06175 [Duodenibacillus sp.]|nr:hypothetical protein [Duodenibacillus sp.]
MKKRTLCALACLAPLVLAGCQSALVQQGPDAQVPADKAVITFYRPNYLGGVSQACIAYDNNGTAALVGVVSANNKLQHVVSPGTHTFVVDGEGSSLMKAKVVAGKSYYAKISYRPGIILDRFALVAMHGQDARTAMKDCMDIPTVHNVPAAQTWFNAHIDTMQGKLNDAKKSFRANRKASKSEVPYFESNDVFTIEPGDGIDLYRDPNFRR